MDPLIRLGHGETEAISLAVEINAELLLMDDRLARRAAESRGLNVAGTLTVLEAAAQLQIIDLPTAIGKLRATNFRVSERLLTKAIEDDAKRRRS